MAPPKGNKFWEIRKTSGRNPIFKSPEQMWEDCCSYFQWVEENPLIEMKPFAYQGVVIQEPVPKMRAMTLGGLCIYLGISDETWRYYRAKDDFYGVVSQVEKIIYEQKFTGAAADLLNSNIIARDLGLSDKKDHTSSDGTMATKEVNITNVTDPKEAANLYREMMQDDN